MPFLSEFYLCGEFRNHLTNSAGGAVSLYYIPVQLLLLKNRVSSATTVTSLKTDNPFDVDAILLNCFCRLLSVSNILRLLDSPIHVQQAGSAVEKGLLHTYFAAEAWHFAARLCILHVTINR